MRIPDIDWVEAADYYVCLHVGPKSHLLRRSMAELERDLDPHLFCRIHRSTIVNLRRVRALKSTARANTRSCSRAPKIAPEPAISQGSAVAHAGIGGTPQARTPPDSAAVQQNVLSGHESGVHTAEERAGLAELGRACQIVWRECSPWSEPRPRVADMIALGGEAQVVAQARGIELPGSKLLMVTFLSATLRATPAINAVRPARAPLDKSSPTIGILTL